MFCILVIPSIIVQINKANEKYHIMAPYESFEILKSNNLMNKDPLVVAVVYQINKKYKM